MQSKNEFTRGYRDMAPISIAVFFFAVTYGTVATGKGVSVVESMLLTGGVFAGASQFMALQFWQDPLPFLTIILIVLAVNFRHILYGASLVGKLDNFSTWQKALAFYFLTDPNYALAEKRHENRDGPQDVGLTPAYFFGSTTILFSSWMLGSLTGVLFGSLIQNPEAFGIDFLITIYFLVLLLGFRSRTNWLPVVLVSGSVSTLVFFTLGSPWHISLGAVAGVIAGAAMGLPDQEPTP